MKKLKFYHLSGITALMIAACSATFSVYGLATLFGTKLSLIALFSILELGKIVSTTMIYNYAKKLPKLLQRYLMSAIVVLMIVTSAGVFGFLSNSYQKSSDIVATTTTAQNYNTEQQNLIAERINNYRQQISNDTTRVDTLNKQRDAQENRLNQAQVALNRRMQTEARADIKSSDVEIEKLNTRVSTAYDNISKENDKLNTLKADSFKIKQEDRKVDVGPLRYLSKMFSSSMDSIVTILILILVFVFDPLAIVLWISTNAIVKTEREQIKRLKPKVIKKIIHEKPKEFGQVLREEFAKFKNKK
jgi:hypothetical protein